MKFISTRSSGDNKLRVRFQEAIFEGLAPDGGLFVPESHLDLSGPFRELNKDSSIADIAKVVMTGLCPDEFTPEVAERVAERAFSFGCRLSRLQNKIGILELFHGPSCAFKDFGASFLASSMEEFLSHRDSRAVILTATSGDTGSAVARAFYQKNNIDVVILYPSGRVSPLQEKQLTTLGGNIHALEVEGSFDDCQRMVKEAFMDEKLNRELGLTSANSINLGRLLPQSFYYIWSWLQGQAVGAEDIAFCIPSGNFGNLTAGIYANLWGLPVTKFLAATNSNSVVPDYLKTGEYKPQPSVATYSNAMDVGNPSNFERLAYIFHNNHIEMGQMIAGNAVSEADTIGTIKRYYDEQKVFLDPHTAVGVFSTEELLAGKMDAIPNVDVVHCLATAHPGKFLEVVEEATGVRPDLPDRLEKVLDLEKQAERIKNSLQGLEEFLRDTF